MAPSVLNSCKVFQCGQCLSVVTFTPLSPNTQTACTLDPLQRSNGIEIEVSDYSVALPIASTILFFLSGLDKNSSKLLLEAGFYPGSASPTQHRAAETEWCLSHLMDIRWKTLPSFLLDPGLTAAEWPRPMCLSPVSKNKNSKKKKKENREFSPDYQDRLGMKGRRDEGSLQN